MHFEQEVYFLLILGFAMVAAVGCAILGVCYAKTHDKNLLWFLGQLVFSILAFYFFFKCILNFPDDPMNSMYSENQSVFIANAGISWAVSMLFEFIGIWKVARSKK